MHDRRREKHRDVVEFSGGHMRVLGPPASGKTSLLLERYRYLESKGFEVAVVTYRRESAESLVQELIPPDTARFGHIPVYTYHTLSREIAGAAPESSGTVVREMEAAVLFDRVLRRTGESLSSDFRNILDSKAFQRTMLDAMHALSQLGISVDTYEELIGATTSRRLRDLLRMYVEYIGYLGSHGFSTYYDEAWRAAELATRYPDTNPIDGYDALLIDDFHDVDPGQYALVRAIARPDGRIRINVFGDPTGARFREKGTSDRFFLDTFAREYAPFDAILPVESAGDSPLAPVQRTLLRETVGEGAEAFFSYDDSATGSGEGAGGPDVRLFVAVDEVAEAAFVAERVVSLLESGRYEPSDVAVVAREKHRYESILTRAFRERGVLMDTGRAQQHLFVYFVVSLLRYVGSQESETTEHVVTTSPYFAALKTVYGTVTDRQPAGDDDPSVTEIRSEIRRTSRAKDGTFDLSTFLAKWMTPVLSLFHEGDLPVDLLTFLGRLAVEWRTYVDVVEETGEARSIAEFLALSRSLSQNARRAPAVPGRVGFYSCRETSSRRFPVVVVVGCSEMLFPALPSREEYVPYGALQDLLQSVVADRPVELFGARSSEDFEKDEYALMLTAFTRADNELTITAPEQHRGTSCPAPSRVLNAIAGDRVERGIGRSPSPYARYVASLVREAGPPAQPGHLLDDFWHKGSVAVRQIEPVERRLSPSSIRSYTTCPRLYFYERILRITDEMPVAVTFGTLFHDLMKSLASDCRTHDALRSVIQSGRLEGYIDKEIGRSKAFDGVGDMVRRAARVHLRDMAERFVELDGARTDDYRVGLVEEPLEFEHRDREFGGIADRIDEGPEGTRVVIDYKTGGGINKTGEAVRRKALPGFNDPKERLWQVPLYLRGARSKDGRDPVLFCYYVIRPGGEDYVVGLYVGDEDAVEAASVFNEGQAKRFAHLTREELKACLDEAAEVADVVFGEKTGYARTDERDHCSNCPFKRVCERTA